MKASAIAGTTQQAAVAEVNTTTRAVVTGFGNVRYDAGGKTVKHARGLLDFSG